MIVAVLTAVLMLLESSGHKLTYAQEQSVPEWALAALSRTGISATHDLDAHVNPFCLRADFDGDGRVDFAAFVREKTSGKIGIAVVHRASGATFVLGAGKTLPEQNADLTWVDAWAVFEKGPVRRGANEGPPPRLRGDALLVFKTESSSALLWWNGKEYQWYWQAD